VRTAGDDSVELGRDEADGAMLTNIRGKVTLVLPDRARNEWISAVVELSTE